jgi:hypothetical protein
MLDSHIHHYCIHIILINKPDEITRIRGCGCDGRIDEIHRGILEASLDISFLF